MAAVRLGIDPDTTYYDSHELMPGWDPVEPTWHVQTDDHSYRGSVSLKSAIIASDNTVYAQLGADVTPERVRQAAYDMGITSHLNAYPAESIGGLRRGVSPLERRTPTRRSPTAAGATASPPSRRSSIQTDGRPSRGAASGARSSPTGRRRRSSTR